MCSPVAAVMAVVAAVSAVSTHEQGRKAASQQQDVIEQNTRDRAATPQPQGAQQPDQVAKRAASAASRAGGVTGGETGTMLTGSGGVTTDLLNLGKNTLLGQ